MSDPRPATPVVPLVLVGPPSMVRTHVWDVLKAHHAITDVERPDDARKLLVDHLRSTTTPRPVVVLLAANLADGLAAVKILRPHREDAESPVLLMVEQPDAVRTTEGLPDDLVRGRWERVDLLLRVGNLVRLSVARFQHAQVQREMLEHRRTSDKYRRALEIERTTLNTMSRYLSPVVLTQIQDGRALTTPRRQDLSVLFSDIRGFTDASGFSAPEELVELLGEYLVEVNTIITGHGGFLDKFMGDGILAYFTPSPNMGSHAARAVASGLQLLERVEELKVSWFERGFLPVGVGVGVTTGQAIMGTIGVGERLDHTVIGSTVNLAARLQGLARGGEVVIDHETMQAVHHKVPVREGRQVNVKGFEQPVTVYTVGNLDASAVAEPQLG